MARFLLQTVASSNTFNQQPSKFCLFCSVRLGEVASGSGAQKAPCQIHKFGSRRRSLLFFKDLGPCCTSAEPTVASGCSRCADPGMDLSDHFDG